MSMPVRTLAVLLATLASGCAPPAEPPPTPAPPTPTVASTSITVVATGDVLVHQGRSLVAGAAEAGRRTGRDYDFTDVFAPVAPILRAADLAVCHLETPVAAAAGPFRGYPSFSAQPQIVDALADAGYDTCSTASNHSLDAGFDGVVRTLDALDAAGVAHAGMFRSAQEAETPDLLDVRGVRVAQVAATFGLNGVPVPAGKDWAVDVFDAEGDPDLRGLLADAARARRAGADVVVASVHCCVEYVADPTAAQRAIARALLASPDVDLVLGHHAHVVQPFERIDGKWVAYGLGNHLAQHSRPSRGETEDSVIARFTFTCAAAGCTATRAEAVPARIVLGSDAVQVVATGGATAPGSDPAADAASRARVTEVLGRRGALDDGLVIADR